MWPDVASFVYAGEMYSERYRTTGEYKYSRAGCGIDAEFSTTRSVPDWKREEKENNINNGEIRSS